MAAPADAPAIAAFLARHVATSMFLLSNLESHGIGEMAHPNGTRFLLRLHDGAITGVFGWTNGGYVMPQFPDMSPLEAAACVAAMNGVHLRGITGPPDQVEALLAALPIAAPHWAINRDDPLMQRDLVDLPGTAAQLRAPQAGDRALLEGWFAAYMRETGSAGATGLRLKATARAQAAIGSDAVRIMLRDARPVAMAAINARAGDMVQFGGVYVPPAHRGQGLAGQLILGWMAALARTGVRRAILFAASRAASAAYTRVGFAQVGAFRVALLDRPIVLERPS